MDAILKSQAEQLAREMATQVADAPSRQKDLPGPVSGFRASLIIRLPRAGLSGNVPFN